MAAPKFPGKGAKPGMYTMPSGEERYYSGGNDFYRNAPGNGAQVFGELMNGSGWRGMSQFDNVNDGRMKGGQASQNDNPFQPNFQLLDFDANAPIRKIIGPRTPSDVNDPVRETPKETPTILPPEETRKNDLGVVSTGKNLGRRSFSDLLNAVAPTPYSSNQLPYTESNPFNTPIKQSAPIDGKYPDFGGQAAMAYDSETGRAAASSRDLTDIPSSMWTNGGLSQQKSAGYTSISPEDPIYAEAFGADKAEQDKKRGKMSNRLSDAINGVKEQEANREITPERRQQMASMAFLNGKDSMDGLKQRDRVNDVVYAGGQHYGRGKNPNDGDIGDKFKIDRADARGIADGSFSAQELLGQYTKDIKDASKDTPAQNQAPLSEAGNAVRDQFAPAKQSDFELNNGDMGDTKPGQKTIDSNFMESADFNDPAQLEEWKRRMNMLR